MRPALGGRVKRAHHKRHRDTEQFRNRVMFEIWQFSERQRSGYLIVRLLNLSFTRWCPRFRVRSLDANLPTLTLVNKGGRLVAD
jgi:hypothetical protein